MIETIIGLSGYILWGILIILAAQHLLGPYLVWKSERVPVKYQFPPVEVSAFLSQQAPAVRDTAARLEGLGFVPCASSTLSRSNVQAAFLLLRHRTEPCSAMLVVFSHARGSIHYTEFNQRFSDGSVLDVMSCPTPSVYPAHPKKMLCRFPGMPETELHAAFDRIRCRVAQKKSPVPTLEPGQELADLARWMDLEVADLIERGYYHRTEHDDHHRVTPKGACLFTLRLVWPWKPLLTYLELSRARRELAAS
jgi:hypothetical protein